MVIYTYSDSTILFGYGDNICNPFRVIVQYQKTNVDVCYNFLLDGSRLGMSDYDQAKIYLYFLNNSII